MKRYALICFLLTITLLLFGACADVTGGGSNQAEPTVTPIPTAPAAARPTYTVQRGTVQEVLEFTGRWLPRDQVELSFEIGGSIRSVNVARGDTVQAGDLLADYQISNLESQLVTAELALENAMRRLESADGGAQTVIDAQFSLAGARLSLESAQAGLPWISLDNAQRDLETAQRNLENAERSYRDTISDPTSSAQASDSAYESLISARERVVQAQNSYYSASQSYYNSQLSVERSENDLIRAEMALQDAIEGTGIDPDLVSDVRSQQINVDQIKEEIAQSSLYAPIDGVVLEVTISPGDSVQAYAAVITLAIPQPSEAIVNMAFNDTQRLDVGMIGTCQVANRPETLVQCIIRQIPFTSRDADQTVRVGASMADFDLALGQLIEIVMPLQIREDTLWLPPAAIRTFQNRTFVVIQTPDGERVSDVELGLQTTDRIEILSGVAEGDVIVGP